MQMSEVAYVALGSNIGDRRGIIEKARASIDAIAGCRIIAESAVEGTEALTPGGEKQPPYLNQIVAVATELTAEQLLVELQAIEAGAGRTREHRWAPRTLDLDIVLFGGQKVNTPTLTIPHPELEKRDFWLRELRQVGMDK
jgi:2-amino-4-hydroxy-6-hydroxymethyldihydropteridine diphosphokinase